MQLPLVFFAVQQTLTQRGRKFFQTLLTLISFVNLFQQGISFIESSGNAWQRLIVLQTL